MTIGASTNAVDISAGTNRGPVVHFSREDKPSSPSSALPTQAGEMAGHVDAVVSIPKALAIDGHELGSTDSTSLRHPPEERALLSTSLNRPMPTPLRYVLPVPPVRPAPYTFRLLQQWEGTVTEVADGEFTAELRDLTDPQTTERKQLSIWMKFPPTTNCCWRSARCSAGASATRHRMPASGNASPKSASSAFLAGASPRLRRSSAGPRSCRSASR